MQRLERDVEAEQWNAAAAVRKAVPSMSFGSAVSPSAWSMNQSLICSMRTLALGGRPGLRGLRCTWLAKRARTDAGPSGGTGPLASVIERSLVRP